MVELIGNLTTWQVKRYSLLGSLAQQRVHWTESERAHLKLVLPFIAVYPRASHLTSGPQFPTSSPKSLNHQHSGMLWNFYFLLLNYFKFRIVAFLNWKRSPPLKCTLESPWGIGQEHNSSLIIPSQRLGCRGQGQVQHLPFQRRWVQCSLSTASFGD